MLIGQLLTTCCDDSCGCSTQILATTKNIAQLESIALKLTKKDGDYGRKFYVKIFNTEEIQDSLSREEISKLW